MSKTAWLWFFLLGVLVILFVLVGALLVNEATNNALSLKPPPWLDVIVFGTIMAGVALAICVFVVYCSIPNGQGFETISPGTYYITFLVKTYQGDTYVLGVIEKGQGRPDLYTLPATLFRGGEAPEITWSSNDRYKIIVEKKGPYTQAWIEPVSQGTESTESPPEEQ